MRRRKGISAWLVTWEALGAEADADIKDRVAAILNPRLNGRRIADIIELIYANATYSLSERIDLVRSKRRNPYPAQLGQLGGLRWEGHVHCGHHPFLQARRVNDLHVNVGVDGEETLVWDELPKPQAGRRRSIPAFRSRRPTNSRASAAVAETEE